MNGGGFVVSFSGVGIAHVVNGLRVGHAVEKDVLLREKPTIGHGEEVRGERQRLRCKIEFQDVVARLCYRWAERDFEFRPVGVWAKY